MKNKQLDKKKLYVILMEGGNGNIYFDGDIFRLTPTKFNHIEAVKFLHKAQKLMQDKSTALKGTYIPKIKRWDYLTNGLTP